ncbi:DUF3369 domain-containing protein [Desulfobacterales bacterium HSG16]|nr:DUF3369 domain-containing protein [Desulfobacterales bacterium HSG16]
MREEKNDSSDELIFAEETEKISEKPLETWKVMIVDDEEEIHKVTKLVLDDFVFDGKGIEFLSAYSGKEASMMIRQHPDTALILLDVVMEANNAGLVVTQDIRETLKNNFVRIILRTGQPGHAPAREVITKYDINDYKLKTILTDHTLFTTVVAAIRTYRDLRIIERNRIGLEQIIEASVSLFRVNSIKKFATGALTQLTSILGLDDDSIYIQASGFSAENREDGWNIIAATGKYSDDINQPIREVVPEPILETLHQASEKKKNVFSDKHFSGYFSTQSGSENLLYMGGYNKPLSELDENLIRIFFTNVAIALDNIDLNREIVDTQKEVIVTLGEVVENRSKETANHVRRVAEYSYLLGKLAHIDKKEAELLLLAAPLHDVGKIGIPDAILNKPGKLTDQEFEIIKTHTTIGHDILKHSERSIMKTGAIIAMEHHEKWDGSGYPKKIAGENIHIAGRIAGFMDVFDALACRRVYKKAWDLEGIIELIRMEKGKHFDPNLVDIFLENLDRFIEIKNRFPDESEPDE